VFEKYESICLMDLCVLSLIWLVGIDLTDCGSGVLSLFDKTSLCLNLQIFK
jgi:hypothetical protein